MESGVWKRKKYGVIRMNKLTQLTKLRLGSDLENWAAMKIMELQSVMIDEAVYLTQKCSERNITVDDIGHSALRLAAEATKVSGKSK